MLATKKDIEKITQHLQTVDRQIYEIQKKVFGINPNLVKQNVEQFLNEEDVKYCKLSIDNIYTQLTAINEDLKKLKKDVEWAKTLEEYPTVTLGYEPYRKNESQECIIDSQKHTIIDLQASKEKLMSLNQMNLKKIQELEYANKTLQEHNTKLENDKIVVKYITYDGVDIDHLQFRLNQAEKQVSELLNERAKLLQDSTMQEMKIQMLKEEKKRLSEQLMHVRRFRG